MYDITKGASFISDEINNELKKYFQVLTHKNNAQYLSFRFMNSLFRYLSSFRAEDIEKYSFHGYIFNQIQKTILNYVEYLIFNRYSIRKVCKVIKALVKIKKELI